LYEIVNGFQLIIWPRLNLVEVTTTMVWFFSAVKPDDLSVRKGKNIAPNCQAGPTILFECPAQIPRSSLRSFSLWARHSAETSAELNMRSVRHKFAPWPAGRCCPKLLFQTKWRNRGRSSGQKLCPHFSWSRAGRSRLVREIRNLPQGQISENANVLATSGAVRETEQLLAAAA